MVVFFGSVGLKSGVQQFHICSHLGSRCKPFWKHPGVPVSVPRPSMDCHDDEPCESEDGSMREPMDSDEDEGTWMYHPPIDLSSIFESLAADPASPVLPSTQAHEWAAEDLGDHGLNLADIFMSDQDKAAQNFKPSTSPDKVDLGTIQWDALQTMHPNRIFCVVIEFIHKRWPSVAVRRCSRKGKKPCLLYELAHLTKDPMRKLKLPMDWRMRSDAYYNMTAWISRLSGRGIRQVRQEMNEAWIRKGKWTQMEEMVKCRFQFLKQLEKQSKFQDAFPELFSRRPNGRSSQSSFVVEATKSVVPLPVTQCHGWLATYNTDLGLHDPEILQWVQQGLRGSELADKLKHHDLLKNAFHRFVSMHKDRAEKHDFKTWAVGLEHSRNAKHPARVHVHTYAGVDIRGGQLLMGVPQARPVSKSGLLLKGCDAPTVRFTVIRRPSPTTILNGVCHGMYYVAGAKESSLMMEASMHPIKD